MKIGILETGGPPPALVAPFGTYPDMIRALLGDARYDFTRYDVQAGELPPVEDNDAYIVTGSPAGVYDDLPWIAALIDWLRGAKGKAKLVGICFGHQVMAEAFGGRVLKSDKGWGIGLHRYEVRERAPWMDDAASFAIPVSHQDQVVELPPRSRVLAGSAFNPFGLIAYDDQPAISCQCHPEFEPAYAQALVESRRGRLPDPDQAIESLDQPDDRARLGEWIGRFLDG
ncbi:type 1 glutamine amidotransferase [Sphingosinicella sp. LY1275]|uniref:type 1 glutamine amidotransferase n=1 Tax=Sphingosinicella sp. LY1275 TaxID=3095379 RepID=UPI002ADECDBF|nr:type 1 glutamine amidotransferase [Sphingosinicella sp. LY1275]MEA1013586.1 type 1 glutamine amidotransferase [Sphingosinicella sp. LY1275]